MDTRRRARCNTHIDSGGDCTALCNLSPRTDASASTRSTGAIAIAPRRAIAAAPRIEHRLRPLFRIPVEPRTSLARPTRAKRVRTSVEDSGHGRRARVAASPSRRHDPVEEAKRTIVTAKLEPRRGGDSADEEATKGGDQAAHRHASKGLLLWPSRWEYAVDLVSRRRRSIAKTTV